MASSSDNRLDMIKMSTEVSLLETETQIHTLRSRVASRTQMIEILKTLNKTKSNVNRILYLLEENNKDNYVVSSLEEVRNLFEEQKNAYRLLLKK